MHTCIFLSQVSDLPESAWTAYGRVLYIHTCTGVDVRNPLHIYAMVNMVPRALLWCPRLVCSVFSVPERISFLILGGGNSFS